MTGAEMAGPFPPVNQHLGRAELGLTYSSHRLYGLPMDSKPGVIRPTPQILRSELERSRDDLAAGRITPLRAVLAKIEQRALQRIERQQQAAQAQARESTEPG